VSELGILAKGRSRYGDGGYLLRTKGEDSNKGGVVVGFSVLDATLLCWLIDY
jgi:hypothetical protein